MRSERSQNLVIIAHLPHYKIDGRYHAYEPYVREIELWAELFNCLEIYTDIKKKGKPGFGVKPLPVNCKIRPIYLKAGPGLFNNVVRLLQFPIAFWHIFFIMIKADRIHLRSPGSTTFIANLINKALNKNTIIKWATSFDKMPGTSKILNWERKLLLNPPSNTRVLIYGSSRNPRHISYFPALFSEAELTELTDGIKPREWNGRLSFICVGRMFKYKNFDLAIAGLAEFKRKFPNFDWELIFIGDGEERPKLEKLVIEGNISQNVEMLGSLPYKEVLNQYRMAHMAIMPGMFEGWPKVVNEAWATGCIPFVVNVGNAVYPFNFSSIPAETFEPNPGSFADALHRLLSKTPLELETIASKGRAANKGMTLEKYQEGIKSIVNSMI